MTNEIKELIEKADALANFPGVFVPSDDGKTDDETNQVWNNFIDALDAAKPKPLHYDIDGMAYPSGHRGL